VLHQPQLPIAVHVSQAVALPQLEASSVGVTTSSPVTTSSLKPASNGTNVSMAPVSGNG
jgi:hypothetical protein